MIFFFMIFTPITPFQQLGLSDTEALQHFRKEFGDAMKNSWKTSLNWAFHAMSKDNRWY